MQVLGYVWSTPGRIVGYVYYSQNHKRPYIVMDRVTGTAVSFFGLEEWMNEMERVNRISPIKFKYVSGTLNPAYISEAQQAYEEMLLRTIGDDSVEWLA